MCKIWCFYPACHDFFVKPPDYLSLSGAAKDREVTERVHPRAEHNNDMVIGPAKSTTLTIRASQGARSTVANTSEAELNEYVRKIAGVTGQE